MRTQPPAVHGEYNHNGYESGAVARSFTRPATTSSIRHNPPCNENRLPLTTIHRFCIKTPHEVAEEQNRPFGGVERVAEGAGQ